MRYKGLNLALPGTCWATRGGRGDQRHTPPSRRLGRHWMEKTHRMEKRTQVRTSFLLLLLLLWSPGALNEMCRSWMFGISRGGTSNETAGLPAGWGAYRCPRQADPPGYRFCCGTCLQPYCCPWAENRLDQVACQDSEELMGLTPQELAAMPPLRHVETSPPATSPPATTSPPAQHKARDYYSLPTLLIILVLASFGGLTWTIFRRLKRLENSLQPVQSSPLPDDDDPPSTSVAAEALHVPRPTVDSEASSPDVEGLQEHYEMLSILDDLISGYSTHPPRRIPKNKAVIPLSCLQANVDGLIQEPDVAGESSSE